MERIQTGGGEETRGNCCQQMREVPVKGKDAQASYAAVRIHMAPVCIFN